MLIQQSTSTDPLLFFMASSADGVTGITGLSPTVTISKAGGAFGAPSGAVTELANGWYKVAGNATDTGTLGELLLNATGTGCIAAVKEYQIVAFNPRSITAFITGVNALAPPTNWNLMAIDASGRTDLGKWLGSAPAALSTNGYVQAMLLRWLTDNAAGTPNALATNRVDASVGAYPGNTAQTGDNYARLGAPAGASIAADLAEIEAETDTIAAGTDPWGVAIPGAYGAGTAGNIVGNRLDAAVSSRTKPADTQTRVTLVDTLTAYTGDTPQTGDSYARLGTPAGVSIAADLAEIEADVDLIAGGGGSDPLLNAVPGSYAAGTAGYVLGTNLDAKVSEAGGGSGTLDLTQTLDTSNTGDTVGGALLAARAQGFGRWVISGGVLSLYAADGTTVVHTFTLTPSPAGTGSRA